MRNRTLTLAICTASTLAIGGCRRAPPEAPEAFSDAIRSLFRDFEASEQVVRDHLLAVEEVVYLGMDIEAESSADRALAPERLSESDLAGLNEIPDRNIADAVPIALGGYSPHDVALHPMKEMLVDHTAVEPYSPNHYLREFLEGESCWADGSCERLETFNDVTKENLLMTLDYTFFKNFRWIDLSEDDTPRMAVIARSWDPESYEGRNGNSWIHQSYTIEVWIPRDGRGFIREGSDTNVDDGTWTTDSVGGGTLRLLSLWSETEFQGLNVTDDQVAATARTGINRNFQAADEWISEQVAR